MPKIAAVQMDITLGDVAGNVSRMEAHLRQTAAAGAALTVFPECAVTGYCFASKDEAWPLAEAIPGPTSEHFTALCRDLQTYMVYGTLEKAGEDLFNAAVLVGPDGVIGTYRKVHLPFLGIDMHTTFGDCPFAVHQAGELRVGMLICYDAAFPEATRALALQGADVIVLPTNWPPGGESASAYVVNARAMENSVYFVAVNRIGTERGFRFIGMSKIADPSGYTLANCETADPAVLWADVVTAKSRNKHIVRVPGKHEIDRLADRRPEMYGLLGEAHQLPRPGRGS